MSTFKDQYKQKLKSADEAVKVIKNGDWVHYGEFVTITPALDKALAKRKDELKDIHIESITLRMPTEVYKVDPNREVFDINDRSLTAVSRKEGCFHIPGAYHEYPRMCHDRKTNVVFVAVCPMDEQGFFNLSTTCSYTHTLIETADFVILEVNEKMPVCYGGGPTAVHISEVSAVVLGENPDMPELPKLSASDADIKIADLVMKELCNDATLQFGIGGIPNKIGEQIVDSDFKNLGVHTEMMMDSFMNLYKAGKVTNKSKNINKGKMVYTFAMGSKELYDFLDKNDAAYKFPVEYTNDPFVISQNDNVFAVNNALHVDIWSQVSSESVGTRQISGVGGQWDFVFGAYRSKGGKGFVCLNSTATRKDANGNEKVESRIVGNFAPGTNITLARFFTYYVVTEFGCVNMKGLSTWQRAEAVIGLAHPDFRDGLIKEAEEFGIWRASNKK